MSFFISASNISFDESWGKAEKRDEGQEDCSKQTVYSKSLTMCEHRRKYNFMLCITQSHNSFYRHQGWCDGCDTWKLQYAKCNAKSENIHLIRICLRLLLAIIALKATTYWHYCIVLGLSRYRAHINTRA